MAEEKGLLVEPLDWAAEEHIYLSSSQLFQVQHCTSIRGVKGVMVSPLRLELVVLMEVNLANITVLIALEEEVNFFTFFFVPFDFSLLTFFFNCFLVGGATDIRTVSGSLASRLFVAGGGGGGGTTYANWAGWGGLVGQDGNLSPLNGGMGGTASAGGAGATYSTNTPLAGAGSLGTGGTAGYAGGKVNHGSSI